MYFKGIDLLIQLNFPSDFTFIVDMECVESGTSKIQPMQKQLSNENNQELRPVKIVANEEISPNVFVVSWRREVDFDPGQVIKIGVNPHEAPRIYSICSGNREENLSVLFNVKPGGKLTPHLSQVKPGDPIFVSEPYGSFSCDESPAFFIATGTGIAPFHSMVRSGVSKNKTLLHGVSHDNQFYFANFLAKELGTNYIPCCSRENNGLYFHGRVTDYLTRSIELPKEDKYYLCGQASMVVEVRDLLIQKGVPYQQIFAEIFF